MAAVPREAAGAGLTICLNGLSPAVKTIIRKAVREALPARGHRVKLLDGVNSFGEVSVHISMAEPADTNPQ